jgi:hypothetical protein
MSPPKRSTRIGLLVIAVAMTGVSAIWLVASSPIGVAPLVSFSVSVIAFGWAVAALVPMRFRRAAYLLAAIETAGALFVTVFLATNLP